MNDPFFPAQLAAAVRRPLRPASQLLPLEQRFMFDGAVADAAHAAQAHESAPLPLPPAVTVRAAEPAKDDGKKEVVLVDTSLANYQSLEAGVRAGVGIVEFDGSRDGLAQIAQWAAGQNGLDAIHILSHGSQGMVDLGSMRLTEAALAAPTTQAELAQLGRALSSDGDLLLYGCDVAAGADGARLLAGIARATGADVAASTDVTGAARLGGNWTLEAHAGTIDARALAPSQYDGTLQVVSFVYNVDGDDSGNDTDNDGHVDTITKTVGGKTFTFSSGGPELYVYNDGNGLYSMAANRSDSQLTITVQSGNTFDLNGLDLSSFGTSLVINYIKTDGTAGITIIKTVDDSGTLSPVTLSLQDVRSVTLSSTQFMTFQNLDITDVKAIAPPTVTVTGAQLSADTGTLSTDFITKTSAQTINGTLSGNLSTGEKVEVSYNNGSTWSDATSAVGSSSWSTTTTLSGSSTFIARVTNGSASTAFSHTYTLDTSAPTITFSGQALSADGGASGTDFITNTSAQTITATLSGAPAGTDIVYGSLDNGAHWTDITSKVSGTSLSWTGATLAAGVNTLLLKVTDAAGNDGTVRSQGYTLDTTAPTTTFSGMTLSADTGSSGTDFVTKTAAQTIGATLSAGLAAGDTVSGSLDGGNTWVDITSKVSGTTLSWTGATLNAGSSSVMFKVSDTAGNDSALSFRAYTLDTTAPTTTIATSKFSSDSGTLSSDLNTNIAAQTISGTLSANVASGETVYVSLNNGATWSAASAAVGQNAWSLGATLTASNTLLVKVSDVAGNDGGVLSRNYVYDTSAPTTTFSGLSLSADTGASNSDFITKTASQTISATLSGALSAGVGGDDILYGTLDNGATWVDITNKVSGTTLTWDGVTLAGSNTLQLKVVDAAGNAGTPQSKAYTLDTGTPVTPGTPDLATASDSGASNSDNITSDTTPTLSGTAENGSTVTLFDGATMLGTVTAGAGGWTYTTGVLSQGGHSITAVSTDTAGNASAASAGLSITVDSVAPTVASVAVPANGTYYGGGTLDFTVNFNEAVLVDTSGGTPSIALTVGAATRQAVYVSGSGGSALVFRYTVPNGDIDANGIAVGALSVNGGQLRDAAGNDAVTTLNSVASTAAVNVDGTNPTITNVGASSADGAYGAGATITISVDFSSAVDVDTTNGTPTLALDGGGSATYTGGSGTNTLSFSYTVGAGQNSADLDVSSTSALALNGATIIDAGGSHQAAAVTLATPGTAGSLGANKDLVIDTAAPGNTVAGVAFSADTGTSNSDFITKTAAQTVSGTLASNLAAGEHVYVSLDNGATWALASDSVGANTWSLAGQTLTGSGTLKVHLIDDAGNIGATHTQAYVLDTTAPTIGFSGIALSADTGASNSDLITNTAAQTISATLSAAPAAGDVVYGSLDNGATWTDISSKVSGTTLTWNGVTLAASDTLKLRVADAAGNNGAATSAAYVLDTSGPATSVATVAFSADSGASSSDFITNTAAQSVGGTLSANLAAGESVLVSLDNGATWAAASATVGGNAWTLAGRTLTASDTLLVKVADTAGNDGAVLSQAYVYDTAATTPGVDPLTTMSLTPVLSGSATLAAGETMTVSVGGAVYDVVPVAGAWSLDLSSAVPVSGALTLVLNHQYSVTASVTDLAGNTASDASSGELIVGSIAQPAPSTGVTGAALSADSGISNSDFITNIAAQTISGSLSAPLVAGESVQVSLDGGTSWQTANVNGSGWTLAGATLHSGGNQLQVKVSSADGDGAVYTQAYVLDTVAPAAPVVDTLTAANSTPTLTGGATLEAGDRLSVTVGGATYDVAVVNGAWSLNLATAVPASGTLALAAGAQYDVVATVTDRAGNTRGDAGGNELTIAGVPGTVVGGVTLSADSGASNSDFITNIAAQTISGTLSAPLAAGQRVEVSLDGGATWRGASAAVGATAWSVGVTLGGSNVLMARVSNDSGAGAAVQRAYALDTTAPTASATSATLSPANVLGGALSAPLAAGESVLVSRDGGASFVVAAVSGATWSSPGAASGAVQVVVRDTAGNSGAVFTANLGAPGEPPVVPPVQPPPPPVLPAPVLTQPPAPADAAPAEPAPADGGPAGVAPPGAPLPFIGGPAIIAPAAIIAGVAPPDSPANPLAPSAVVLADVKAQLSVITPNGLPELPFASDMILATVPIADLVVGRGERISVQLAPDTFTSTSSSKAGFELSAESSDGKPLPSWLKFDSATARFEGTPPAGFEGTLSFKVTARDAHGRIAVQTFKIVVTRDGQAAPVKSTSLERPLVEPVGRSALSDQMRMGGKAGTGADRLAMLSRSAAAAKAHA